MYKYWSYATNMHWIYIKRSVRKKNYSQNSDTFSHLIFLLKNFFFKKYLYINGTFDLNEIWLRAIKKLVILCSLQCIFVYHINSEMLWHNNVYKSGCEMFKSDFCIILKWFIQNKEQENLVTNRISCHDQSILEMVWIWS